LEKTNERLGQRSVIPRISLRERKIMVFSVKASKQKNRLNKVNFNIFRYLQAVTLLINRREIMPDNLKIKQPQDPKYINIHEEWELAYWSKELGVTKEKIKEAVNAVGTSVAKVKQYLKK
jgi:hypothetical protein